MGFFTRTHFTSHVIRIVSSLEQIIYKQADVIQGVLAKTFGPNNSVIFQRIFVKFKLQIHILDGEE
jgi:hypothetical protein